MSNESDIVGNAVTQDSGAVDARANKPLANHEIHNLARLVLAVFILTFVTARILVIFIMAGKLPPGLFFHVSGTHIHHLNYGIFLLSISGGVLLFARPVAGRLRLTAVVYAIGLALTFDEFGMWLHLGGLYWQRASYDAVITIAAVLALIAYGSQIRHWRPAHHFTVAILLIALIAFGYVLNHSMKWADRTIGPALYHLEEGGPT
jgi:cation transport ATPase